MHESSTTAVARLASDGPSARQISETLGELFEPEEVVASAFEEPDGRWSLTLHFRQPPDEAAVRAQVAAVAGATVADTLTFETLAPADWVRLSLEGLTPVDAGRFTVHIAHHRARVLPNRIGIEIEAALAFGTGHHGTTRGCLIALDALIKGRRPRSILDVGTGTGVLAIAAARTLRRPVLASDIDPRAVTIARDNARLNRTRAQIETIHAAGLTARRFRARGPYDLVFANILLEPLEKIATPMARLTEPNGHIVLSGLLLAQATPALARYRARGFVLVRRIKLEGWMTLVLRRPGRR